MSWKLAWLLNPPACQAVCLVQICSPPIDFFTSPAQNMGTWSAACQCPLAVESCARHRSSAHTACSFVTTITANLRAVDCCQQALHRRTQICRPGGLAPALLLLVPFFHCQADQGEHSATCTMLQVWTCWSSYPCCLLCQAPLEIHLPVP